MDFKFDQKEHRYYLGKRELPSVTRVLAECGLIHHAGREALERGQIVHRCCELLNQGKLDWSTVDERIIGHVYSYQAAIEHMGWIAGAVEVSAYDGQYLYGGTYDVCFKFVHDKPDFLIDIKSGARSPWHRAQLGAYWGLNGRLGRVGNLYTHEDGAMATLVEHDKYEAWNEFITCINFYRLKERYGKSNNLNPGL